jgi:uncharacterized protein YndB with AHSA1/START domain
MAVGKNDVVTVEHEFPVSVEALFEALKAGRLFYNCGAWAEGTSIDFRVGGKYRVSWGRDGVTYGEFTEIVENKRVAFTWNFDEMEVRSRVLVELEALGKRSRMKLRHDGFPNAEAAKLHDGGWCEVVPAFGTEVEKNRVLIDREFQVPVEALWEACTGASLLARLGAVPERSKLDFRVGGAYELELPNGKRLKGEFLEIETHKKLVLSWAATPPGMPTDKATTVTMEFGPWGDEGRNSYLQLLHEGFPSKEAARAHHGGWLAILWKLYQTAAR